VLARSRAACHGSPIVRLVHRARGREYLRIIYGPEYTRPENLSRLKARGLGHKRPLAVREFALGIEAPQRFVRRERFGVSTSVSLECSRWRPSLSIRGYDCSTRPWDRLFRF